MEKFREHEKETKRNRGPGKRGGKPDRQDYYDDDGDDDQDYDDNDEEEKELDESEEDEKEENVLESEKQWFVDFLADSLNPFIQ